MSKQAILANYPDAARWAFGDGPELADKSLAFWRRGHREFFTREGTFAADMWLVFEEFALVEIL